MSLVNIRNSKTTSCNRFKSLQRDRSLHQHPVLDASIHHPAAMCQNNSSEHTFVVCADTQFGMIDRNRSWEKEMEYSRRAVQAINALQPRPLFCCVCGDLVDMTSLIYSREASGGGEQDFEECNRIQDAQNEDFKSIWAEVHPDIALVCLCGNHDVGNRPTRASIDRFAATFGDDYLAWWANGTYNIVVNTCLFADPTGALDLFQEHLSWLQNRLEYATRHKASHIFVFGHHPWFLYRDDETSDELSGVSLLESVSIGDRYFHIPFQYRRQALTLFEQHDVTAAFAGHFHQNLCSKSSFGMDMIITGPLTLMLQSSGIPADFSEPKTQGIRIVCVDRNCSHRFKHKFVSI